MPSKACGSKDGIPGGSKQSRQGNPGCHQTASPTRQGILLVTFHISRPARPDNHTWTPAEVRQFEERHPIGTKARLALSLLLFTGQRRSDITRFGRQHVRDGKITFTQYKGRDRKPKQLTLPILPVSQRIISASPCGDLTFLVNDLGRAFTDAGFGNKFREWCDQAGLPNCSAHGLRKAGATIAAENGATAHMLMAIFGWDTLKMAEGYTRAADQKRLAESA